MNALHLPRTPTSGALSPKFLAALREGYEMSPSDRACHNAVTNNDVNNLALNRDAVRGDDGHFSHRIKSKGITNQNKSGRCWMFAALNIMRPKVIRDHNMEEFEFSTAYLQFWDKLENSNLYLESIIELREADHLDRDWEIVNRGALQDGGWWNYIVGLIGKYGMVPVSAMPETHSSANTATLNHILGRMLRVHAVRILKRHADGATIEILREEKEKALKAVYRFLVINLGEPPTQFEWRYRINKKRDGKPGTCDTDMHNVAEEDVSALETHTPQSFYKKYVDLPLADYICLYNDPQIELGRHYLFNRANNIVGNKCMHFVNIDMETMKKISIESILANEPVWFAVDMNIDQSKELGLMEHRLFDYESLFGIDLTMSKADRIRFHTGRSCHAMVLMGVDLSKDGRPRKWLVENSWGDDKGKKGRWTLHDKWFNEHVYTLIVHKRHVDGGIMERFNEEPRELPAWYPSAIGASCGAAVDER